ncbi:MAG: thioredoxin [Haloarculaceae archaeon]
MSDAEEADDIDAIREQKKEELEAKVTAPDEPIHVDGEDHFEDVIGDYPLVLVDFYADWCGPCKMLEPIVEDIAAETAATVAKVDIDAHQMLARKHNVQGVPTLYLFADGEEVERLVGVQDRDELTTLVEKYA